MSHRTIFECKACMRQHCTVRVWGDEPPKDCLYYMQHYDWVRKDKHDKEITEYEV